MIEKNWKELIKPSKIDVQSSDDKKISKIVVEPLERGFALTLGNALRRVLLSSLEGFAFTSIKIENVDHEFTSCLLYTSPSPRDRQKSRMPSSA